MIRAVLAAALSVALTACGTGNGSGGLKPPTGPKDTPLGITWSDGNPLVPMCQTVLTNCKSSYTVLDETMGVATILPITSDAYSAPDSTHIYQVRVDGYAWDGRLISSAYETVPIVAK